MQLSCRIKFVITVYIDFIIMVVEGRSLGFNLEQIEKLHQISKGEIE